MATKVQGCVEVESLLTLDTGLGSHHRKEDQQHNYSLWRQPCQLGVSRNV